MQTTTQKTVKIAPTLAALKAMPGFKVQIKPWK